jgi:hypothetical protein
MAKPTTFKVKKPKTPKPITFSSGGNTDFHFGHNVGGGGGRPKKGNRPGGGGGGTGGS